MRLSAAARLLIVSLGLLLPAPAFAVKRDIIKELQSDYAGKTYQTRLDLRGTDYFASVNVVDEKGVHYRGRELAVMFYQMELVYLDRVSNESEREVRLTLYRSRNDARQIRGSIPAAPLPVGPDSSTMGAFARQLSTNVILELTAGKDDPSAQRQQIAELMEHLFYIKEVPTFDQKETFILTHPDLPLARLMAITGLNEEMVTGIQKRHESGEKPEKPEKP